MNIKKDCSLKHKTFTCDKCYKTFTYNSQYQLHINKKFSCIGNNNDIKDNDVKNNDIKENKNNDVINNDITDNKNISYKQQKTNQCTNCYKWYTTKRSLNSHQKICKMSHENNKNSKIDIVNNLKKMIKTQDEIINKIFINKINDKINNTNINLHDLIKK